jgi:hypothetical protein
MITAAHATEKGHAILCRSMARSHDVAASTGRCCSVDRSDGARGIFSAVVRDVQPDDRRPTSRRSPLDKEDLGNLPVLAEVIIGPEGWNELEHRICKRNKAVKERRRTSSLANRGPMPTT